MAWPTPTHRMGTPQDYGNAAQYFTGTRNSKAEPAGYLAGINTAVLGGSSSLPTVGAVCGYSGFDLSTADRRTTRGSIWAARVGPLPAAFPVNRSWSWRTPPT